jgi:hypothetical protein
MSRRAISRHLGACPLRGLSKVGDCLVPGDEDLPSFAQSGCIAYVDHILDYLPVEDRADLGRVLRVLAFLPSFAVRWLLALLEADLPLPDRLAAPLRYLRLGLRGLVLSLYYSEGAEQRCAGKTPLQVLGYRVGVAGNADPSPPRHSLLWQGFLSSGGSSSPSRHPGSSSGPARSTTPKT